MVLSLVSRDIVFRINICFMFFYQPSFTLCVDNSTDDRASIFANTNYDTILSSFLGEILTETSTNSKGNKAVLLDIGENLGLRGLYAAKLGYRTWIIDPNEENFVKVI